MRGITHFEFIPQGKTVNNSYPVETMKRLHEAVYRRGREIWPSKIFHHDNAPAHRTQAASSFWITELERPPYSPDLTPNDVGLFQKIIFLKETKTSGY